MHLCPVMGRGVGRFTELRAWQACDTYKKAIYRLTIEGPLSTDWDRRRQLERSVAAPGAHIAEGYGRFNPPDFARFTVMARASLMESQSHLLDARDKGYLSEAACTELNALAGDALAEVTGLIEYLQSPEALRNARRARERRIASRADRQARRLRTPNPEPRTPNLEPNQEDEPGTEHREP